KTSSAALKVSANDAPWGTAPNKRSLGIVITVSTDSCNSFNPCSACCNRRRPSRSEEHSSELQSRFDLVCRLLLEKKKSKKRKTIIVELHEVLAFFNRKRVSAGL